MDARTRAQVLIYTLVCSRVYVRLYISFSFTTMHIYIWRLTHHSTTPGTAARGSAGPPPTSNPTPATGRGTRSIRRLDARSRVPRLEATRRRTFGGHTMRRRYVRFYPTCTCAHPCRCAYALFRLLTLASSGTSPSPRPPPRGTTSSAGNPSSPTRKTHSSTSTARM